MNAQLLDLGGMRILELSAEGPPVQDAAELISQAWEHDAALVAIPAERLGGAFFKLSTGVAGEIVQKFANYRLGLAILGDISAHVANSNAFRSFVSEASRSGHPLFVADREALTARLKGKGPGAPPAP